MPAELYHYRMTPDVTGSVDISDDSDYYSVLGVESRASLMEIKRAYRALVLQLHPDRQQTSTLATTTTNPSTVPDTVQRVIEAYRVLSDEQLKSDYDQHRLTLQQQGEQQQ